MEDELTNQITEFLSKNLVRATVRNAAPAAIQFARNCFDELFEDLMTDYKERLKTELVVEQDADDKTKIKISVPMWLVDMCEDTDYEDFFFELEQLGKTNNENDELVTEDLSESDTDCNEKL